MNPKCEVEGCKADATYTVGCNCHRAKYGAERHILGACSDCRDQLMEWGWELILPERRGGSMNPTCDIDGCRQDAVATVRSNNSAPSKALAVCHDCLAELTSVFGYELAHTVEGLDAA